MNSVKSYKEVLIAMHRSYQNSVGEHYLFTLSHNSFTNVSISKSYLQLLSKNILYYKTTNVPKTILFITMYKISQVIKFKITNT